MTLEQICEKLSEDNQIRLGINLIQRAIPIWDNYAENNLLSYRDTVVGLIHTVSKDLLSDTIKEIKNYISSDKKLGKARDKRELLKLYLCFDDPIVALQDTDWELPHVPEMIFYSVYNLLSSIVKSDLKAFTVSVSINQAIDAIQNANLFSDTQIRQILVDAQNGR